ncbi:MAG TPA: VanW family protein [bacterium]|nr:VanW family protein [bacterium]HOL34500.1 VanW family protein [bacterium]HPP08662.1 VanW family protein [bacterium]
MKKIVFQLIFLLSIFAVSYCAEEFKYQWSSYTTYFRTNIDQRQHNIKIATMYLDGFVLYPKTIFSFNNEITEKIPEEQLGPATIVSGEQTTVGFGGGLCQISSTLYAASLYAGLSIYERKSHSKPVGYINMGLDATVANDEGVDLKIFNPYRCKLLIKASVIGNGLNVSIFGSRPKPNTVVISVSKPERKENFLYTTTTRTIFSSGKEIFSEIVSIDKYLAPE